MLRGLKSAKKKRILGCFGHSNALLLQPCLNIPSVITLDPHTSVKPLSMSQAPRWVGTVC